MSQLSDEAAIASLRGLAEAELHGLVLPPIVVGPFTAFTVIGALQLALRHPEAFGEGSVTREQIEGFVAQLRALYPPDVQRCIDAGAILAVDE